MKVSGSFLAVLSAFVSTASAIPMPQAPTPASSYSVAIAATSGFAYPSVSGAFPTDPAPPRVTSVIGAPAPVVGGDSSKVVIVKGGKHRSFDRWGGFESLQGFDDFYGIDNWDGRKFEQIFVKDKNLVCRSHESHIIQQRLLVVQEMAKRTLLESICDVEAQTIIWSQFLAGLSGFERDIVRAPRGHHQIGFDEGIVSHFPKFINHDGSLNDDDWKFTGRDLGRHTVLVGGHNWDPRRSFKSVRRAWEAARNAYFNIHGQFFS